MCADAAERTRTKTGAGSLAATQAEQLDQACDQFEAAWRGGRKPRIEDHLEVADESMRAGPPRRADRHRARLAAAPGRTSPPRGGSTAGFPLTRASSRLPSTQPPPGA